MKPLLPLLLSGLCLAADAPSARVSGRVAIGMDQTVEMIGYYTHIAGFQAPLFASGTAEKTAYFSFRTERAPVQTTNDGTGFKLKQSGEELLHVYYHPLPDRDFAKPDTFAEVQMIASYKTRGGEASVTPGGQFSYSGDISLHASSDFVVEGKKYNLRDLGLEFTLKASGTSPSIEELGRQASTGKFTVNFTGSAVAKPAQPPPPPDTRSR
ncbi:MAG: hypothetical protein FJW39_05080 [Acidobacteria bacterium]|nr:hypothetical protein [Acidobacteriota bacterium]